MKKFVGYVNGKSFDNEKDFNKAAQEAIESGDENLSISSYYQYSLDEREEAKDAVKDDRFVSTHEYFLGDAKPEVKDDNLEYVLPDELKKKIVNASNINDIRKSVEYHISTLSNSAEDVKETIEKYKHEIFKLQEELDAKQYLLRDLNARSKYYETILDLIVNSLKKNEEVKEVEEKKEKEDVKRVLGIDGNMTLSAFLKQLGLLK